MAGSDDVAAVRAMSLHHRIGAATPDWFLHCSTDDFDEEGKAVKAEGLEAFE